MVLQDEGNQRIFQVRTLASKPGGQSQSFEKDRGQICGTSSGMERKGPCCLIGYSVNSTVV